MYLKNTTQKNITLTSFEGFEFEVPMGNFWIWDKAGEHLLKTFEPTGENGKWGYDYNAGQTQMGKGKVFIPKAPPTPAIIETSKEEWEKDGKKLSQVKRFKVKAELIPKESLIKIASERGVSQEKIVGFMTDKTIDKETITEIINNLPIPEHIKYPKDLESDLKNNEDNKNTTNN